MTQDEMQGLKPGDYIRHKMSPHAYQVHHSRTEFVHTYGNVTRVTAVRVTEASNPDEWDIVDGNGTVISTQ